MESAVLDSFCQSRFCLKQLLDKVLHLNRYFQKFSCTAESKHCGFNVFESVGPLFDFPHIGIDHSCAWRTTSWLLFLGNNQDLLIGNNPSQYTGNQAKVAGSLHGWTRSSWRNSDMKKEAQKSWKQGQMQQAQEEYRDMVQVCRDGVKDKSHLKLNLSGYMKGSRSASPGLSSTKGRLEKIWGCCWMETETWSQQTWRRLKYSVTSSLPFSLV